MRTPIGKPDSVHILDQQQLGLPELPSLGLVMHQGEKAGSVSEQHLSDLLIDALQDILEPAWLVP